MVVCVLVFFKQKTSYEMRISDWRSDLCSSVLPARIPDNPHSPIEKRIGDTERARPRLSDLIPIALALLLFGAFGVHARASDLVGHVYMQTNETQNRIMHFGRSADGPLKLLESIPTGGAGSGVFKDRKSTRLNSSHSCASRMPSSA